MPQNQEKRGFSGPETQENRRFSWNLKLRRFLRFRKGSKNKQKTAWRKMKEEKIKIELAKNSESCNDRECPVHGSLKIRGRQFKGYVIRKFPRRIAIEFERTIYMKKYERYAKKKTRIHARLPKCMQEQVNVGDYILVQECRPLSKIIHFVYIGKVKANDMQMSRIAIVREKEK